MISGANGNRVAASAGLAALLAFLLLAIPARAAEPIFPTGSRIGLVPPSGMAMSRRFPGFEDLDTDAAIVITTLPAAVYAEMENSQVPAELKKQGITLAKREPLQLRVGKGFLLTGEQVTDKARYRKWLLVAAADDLTALVSVRAPERDNTYSDAVVRAALATLAVRATVPDAERLSLLPFAVGDLAGFQIEGILPGRALMLVDVPADHGADTSGQLLTARLLVAALPGGPDEADDRGNFARLAFNTIGGIKDVQITMSEPLRLGGQQGYQTMAQAKDSQSDTDIMVVQWLRFGSGGFLQMVGIAKADMWTTALTRMRAVRDSIEPK